MVQSIRTKIPIDCVDALVAKTLTRTVCNVGSVASLVIWHPAFCAAYITLLASDRSSTISMDLPAGIVRIYDMERVGGSLDDST